MKNIAQQIGKMEGWKYSPLFALSQNNLPDGDVAIRASTPIDALDISPKLTFSNSGDQIVADAILQRAKPRHIVLGDTDAKSPHAKLDIECNNIRGHEYLFTDARGEFPLTLQENIAAQHAQLNFLHVINVEENCHLTHVRMIDSDEESLLLTPVFVRVEKNGSYTQILLTHGAKLLRTSVQGELLDVNAHVDLRGVHILESNMHVDHCVFMNHFSPNCSSNQAIRFIVKDEAIGAFQGKIHVARDAQKTSAYQLCKSLLLSDAAQVNTKPELEIFADDVKCSHGATIGALDKMALFYLQSRGIPKAEAEKFLIEAFVEEVFTDVTLPAQTLDKIESFLS